MSDSQGCATIVVMWACGKQMKSLMSRLTIDITTKQHQTLKALAALQGKSIKQYALERLLPDDLAEDQAWQELGALLRNRIEDGLAGEVSSSNMQEILDDELTEGNWG